MKKINWKKLFIYIIIIFIITKCFHSCTPKLEIGKEIDRYQNVAVFFNGEPYTQTHGKHYSKEGYYYGLKWQCVEYVKRFYFDAKNHKMPNVYGNAKDFFSYNVPPGMINPDRGLIQYYNGGYIKPKKDDLIVFTNGKYGHVAIISDVNLRSIEIIQQNVEGKTRKKLKLTKKKGRYFVEDNIKPAGWLRKEHSMEDYLKVPGT